MTQTTTEPDPNPGATEWDARIKAERAEAHKTYDDLYNGVAACLEGWNVVRDEKEGADHYNERVYLVDASGSGKKISLSLKTYGADRGKVHVFGYWPQNGNHGPYTSPRDVNEASPSINCSLAKGYSAIAADIRRRFLPEYHRIYAKCSGRITDQIIYASRQAANWAKISAVASVQPHHNRPEAMAGDIRIGPARKEENAYNYDGGYGNIHMSSADSVQIELRSVPVERALAILKAIAEVK